MFIYIYYIIIIIIIHVSLDCKYCKIKPYCVSLNVVMNIINLMYYVLYLKTILILGK